MHTAPAIPLLSRPSHRTSPPIGDDGGSGSGRFKVALNCLDDSDADVFTSSNDTDISDAAF